MASRELRYLLHLWHEGDGGLRASLRNVSDGELRLFTGLADLHTFLEASAGSTSSGNDTPDERPASGG